MSRLMITAFVLLGLSSSAAWAQCGCCDGGTVVASTPTPVATGTAQPMAAPATAAQPNTYQRFSYQPSTATAPGQIVNAAPMTTMAPAMTVQPRSTGVRYRRYSYRPHPQPWELQRSDPRRWDR